MNFIDLNGASGATYRFRVWPGAGRHSPTAGNYVVVTERGQKVLAVGMLDDLSRAERQVAVPKGALLYTRLNIGRQMREGEHADLIAAGHAPADCEANLRPDPQPVFLGEETAVSP